MSIDQNFISRYSGWGLSHALAHVDARLSKLEAEAAKPKPEPEPAPETREPGWYWVFAAPPFHYKPSWCVMRWADGRWWFGESLHPRPQKIGPRIQEPGE